MEAAAITAALGLGAVLVFVPHGLIFAATFFTLVFGASVWRPSFGIAALLATVPIQTSVTFDLGTHYLTFTKIALAALVLGWLLSLAFTGDSPTVDAVTLAFIIYVCALIASVWNAQDRGAWAGETYRWITAGAVYVIARHSVRRRDDLVAVFFATSAAVLACTTGAVVQVVRHAGPPSFTIGGVTRAFGAFGEPNPFAGYFEIAALPLVGISGAFLLSSQRKRYAKTIAVLGASGAAGLLGIYLTHSRGGAISTAAGLLAIALLIDRRVRVAALALIGIIALALTLAGSTGRVVHRADSLAHRWDHPVQVTGANFSVEERIAHWGAAVRMWEAHPIVGVGAGNFNANFRVFTPEWRFRIPRGHAHNGYLEAAAQAGTFGLLAYVCLLAAAVARAGRVLKKSTGALERGVAVGAIAATVAVMAHGMFDYLHVLNLGLQLSVVWACAELSICRRDGEPKRSHVD